MFAPEVLEHIRSVIWKNTVAVRLCKGDVLVYDNLFCGHSRMGCGEGNEDSDRRILVGLADPLSQLPL